MQNKILEILKKYITINFDPPLQDGDISVYEMIASEISSQFTVIAEGHVECDYRLDEVFRLNNKPISYYFEDYASGLDGKKIQLILREVKWNI